MEGPYTEWYVIYIDYETSSRDLFEHHNLREVIKEIKELQKEHSEKLRIDKWVYDNGNGYPEPIAEIDYDNLLGQV